MAPVSDLLPRRVDRWSLASTGGGAVLWAVLVLADRLGPIDTWLTLAVLVLVPMAVALIATRDREGRYSVVLRAATLLQPPAALGVVGGSLLGPGLPMALLVAGWIPVTGLLALAGLWRLLPRGLRPVEELLVDAGLVYLPVGAVALELHALGIDAGFRPVIIHLTAIHYHYAGFLLPVVAGLTGRVLAGHRERAVYRPAAVVVVLGMVLIAVGITASPAVEVLAAVSFAAAVVALAAVTLWVALRPGGPVDSLLARGLLAVAGVSVVVTMAYAAAYAYGAYAGVETVTIGEMVATHGRVNALGFALAGLVAWHLAPPAPRPGTPPPGIPFSRLRTRWRAAPDYPERRGIAGEERGGLVEDLAVYARQGFDPDGLHPDVRSFYEATGEWDLRYRIRWLAPFRTGARLALALTGRIEQLNLPGPGDPGPHGMDGRIVDVVDADARDHPDRESPRTWVRTDPGSGESVFVAVYATHAHRGETYMNIALPLPGANLTAILYPEPVEGEEHTGSEPPGGDGRAGWRLSTRRTDGPRGDEGLYLATPLVPVRLPVHETFRVWPADAPTAPAPPDGIEPDDPDLVATHEMWLLGRQFLEIAYAIDRK